MPSQQAVTSAPDSHEPAHKLKPRSAHLAIACCILLTLLLVGGNFFARQVLPTPASLALPAATVLLFLTMSWSIHRGHTNAFRVLIFLASALYLACWIVFGAVGFLRKILGDVQQWVIILLIGVLLWIHWYFVEVLYEYAVQLAEEDKRKQDGVKGEGQV